MRTNLFIFNFFLFMNTKIITKFKMFKIMLSIATKNKIKNCDEIDDNDKNVFNIITQKKTRKNKI